MEIQKKQVSRYLKRRNGSQHAEQLWLKTGKHQGLAENTYKNILVLRNGS